MIRGGISHVASYAAFLERYDKFDEVNYAESVKYNHPGHKQLPDGED